MKVYSLIKLSSIPPSLQRSPNGNFVPGMGPKRSPTSPNAAPGIFQSRIGTKLVRLYSTFLVSYIILTSSITNGSIFSELISYKISEYLSSTQDFYWISEVSLPVPALFKTKYVQRRGLAGKFVTFDFSFPPHC